MLVQLLAALGVLGLLTVVPGPDMAVVTKRSLASGWQDGLRTAGGIAVGLLVWGALSVLGLAAVLAASATAFSVVKVLAAVFLLYLGVQTLWRTRRQRNNLGADGATSGAAPATPSAPAAPSPSSLRLLRSSGGGSPWRTGIVTDLVNPKIGVFYTGLLPTLAPDGLPSQVGMGLLVVLHVAMTLLWLGAYVVALAKARAFFERPRVRRTMDRVTGVVLIGFGVQIATTQA